MNRSNTKKFLLIGIVITAVLLCVVLVLAVFGVFSNSRRSGDVNALGGTGSLVRAEENCFSLRPLFYDNDYVYIYTTYDTETMQSALCRMSFSGGAPEPLCTRVNCEHDTIKCPFYFLNSYDVIDGKLVYFNAEGNSVKLYEWDVISDKKTYLYDFPRYFIKTDEDGEEVELEIKSLNAWRINENNIIAQCANTIYIFDNDFNLLDSFPWTMTSGITGTSDVICFTDGYDYRIYDIAAKTMSDGIIVKHFSKEELENINNITDLMAFYGDCFYYARNNKLMRYNYKNDTFEEVLDILIDHEHYITQIKIFDGKVYYRTESGIFRYDIETGKNTEMPELCDIPRFKTNKYLVASSAEENKLVLYNSDGKRVS